MSEQTVPRWAYGQLKLRDSMRWWIEKSAKAWEHTPWGGGHDEAIFTRTWQTYYLLTGNGTAYNFTDRMVHDLIDGPEVEACTCFLTKEDAAAYPNQNRRPPYHGYPEDQACFVHAPENYAWFLTHMAHISRSPKVMAALEDCAEHVGNWSPDCPAWYDWDNHRFRSALFGTGKVRDYPPYDFEPIALVRVMVLAANMYYLTQQQKYLDLCVDWADKWTRIVLGSDPDEGFPTTLFPCPDEEVDVKYGELARAKNVRAKLDYELANFLLDIFYCTATESYAQAVHKMLNTELDWARYAGGNAAASGLLVAKYRALTGDHSFDERTVEIADAMMLNESDNRPAIALMNKTTEQFLDSPGLQYIRLFKDGRVELDNRRTGILTAAWIATGRTEYLEYAMDLAFNRFQDSHYIWDGRELGCRGSWQGRNGVAMHNVIPPMMLSAMGGFGMLEGERPWYEVRYAKADGAPGLPETVAALFVPSGPKERTVKFFNTGEREETIAVTADSILVSGRGKALRVKSVSLDGQIMGDSTAGITVPAGRLMEVRIELG